MIILYINEKEHFLKGIDYNEMTFASGFFMNMLQHYSGCSVLRLINEFIAPMLHICILCEVGLILLIFLLVAVVPIFTWTAP